MKKGFLTGVVLLAFTALGTAATMTHSTQSETMWRPVLYLGGGASIPTSNFRNDFKTGYNLGGGVGVEYKSMLEAVGEIFYSRFPLDQNKFLARQPLIDHVSGGAANVVNYGALLRYFVVGGGDEVKVRPYVLGRIGVAHMKQSDLNWSGDGLTGTTSYAGQSKFTWGLGAGSDFRVNRNLALWVEGRFTGISTPVKNTDYVPIQAGIRYLFGRE